MFLSSLMLLTAIKYGNNLFCDGVHHGNCHGVAKLPVCLCI